MLVINLLLLSSKFILPCLLSKNGSGPFKYLAFDSRLGVKLCQWGALETRRRRKEFSFLGWSRGLPLQCPAGSSSSPWLTPTGRLIMKSFCWDTSPWTVFPSTWKGRFPANSASVSLQQFLCIYSVNLNHALSNMGWFSALLLGASSLGIYLSSWASGCFLYMVLL